MMDFDVFDTEPESVVFEADQDSGRKAFHLMNSLRKSHKFCDVVLQVGELQLPSHKVVLSSSSPYFWAMFTSSLAESELSVVELRDVNESAVRLLIDYIYMGRIEIKTSNVQNLLQASSMFQLSDVVNACCKFLADQLHPSNCLGINEFADLHTCEELKSSSNQYIEENYMAVSEEEEFCQLSCSRLACLLSSENIHVSSEAIVYQSLMRWIKYDLNTRKQYLSFLLSKIKLAMLDVAFLIDVVEKEELITGDVACWDLVNKAKNYHLLPHRALTPAPNPTPANTSQAEGAAASPPAAAAVTDNYEYRPRKSTLGHIFYIGGMDSSGSLKTVERLDAGSGSSVISMAAMNVPRSGIGVAVLNGCIYAVGGHDGTCYLNSVECYDPVHKKWSMVANMNCPRRYVAVCAYNGLLYVAGGYSGITVLNSVEVYDPESNTWKYATPMNCRRRHVSMALLSGKLFAVGGHDGISYLKSVEEYDPVNDCWRFVKNMHTRRGGAGVAALGGKLYAIGGYDGNSNHSTMERYHPEEDRWSMVAPMSGCRSGLGVAVIHDRIFAIGGHDGVHYLNIVEVFDPKAGEWHVKCHMMSSRAVAGVAVLHAPST